MDADGLVVPGVGAFAAVMGACGASRGDELIDRRLAGGAGARHLRRHAGDVRARRRARRRDRGPRRVAGHGDRAATRPCCRTWAGTRSTPDEDSVLFDGIERRALLLRPLLRRHRVGARRRCRRSRSRALTWAEHGERFLAAVENGPLSATQFHPEKSGERRHPPAVQLARHALKRRVSCSCHRAVCWAPMRSRDRARGAMTEFNTTPGLTLLPAVDVAGRQGRAADPGRGRHRDQLRRPGRGGRRLGAPGRRVDPPRRPRRRVRARQQPRGHQQGHQDRSRGVNIELSGGIRDDALARGGARDRRQAHQPRHRRAREPRVGRRTSSPSTARRSRSASTCAARRSPPAAGRRTAATCGRSSTVSRRPAAPLRRHRRHEGRHAAGPEHRAAARRSWSAPTSRSSPPAASPASTTSRRCASSCRSASRARSSARRSTPGRSRWPRRWTSPRRLIRRTVRGAADSAGEPWAGRSLRSRTPHAGDDGSAPAATARGAARASAGEAASAAVVDALRDARLLDPARRRAAARAGVERARADRRQDAGAVDRDGRRARRPHRAAGVHLGRRDARAGTRTARPDPGRRRPGRAAAAASEETDLVVLDPTSDTEFVVRRPALWAIGAGAAVGAELRGSRGARRASTTRIGGELAVRRASSSRRRSRRRASRGPELRRRAGARSPGSTRRSSTRCSRGSRSAGPPTTAIADARRLARREAVARRRARATTASDAPPCGQLTGPVHFSPGPLPRVRDRDASRNASCSERSPSRSGRACMSPSSGAAAVTRPARALMSLRASSRSSLGVRVVGEAALDGGGAQQVHGDGVDDLDGGDVGDVPRGLGLVLPCRRSIVVAVVEAASVHRSRAILC